MAIQDQDYEATERDFWSSKVGTMAPNTPFNQVKREGIEKELGGGVPVPVDMNEAERLYIKTILKSNYGLDSSSQRIPALWVELAGAAGISTTGKPWRQCRHEYFLFVY